MNESFKIDQKTLKRETKKVFNERHLKDYLKEFAIVFIVFTILFTIFLAGGILSIVMLGKRTLGIVLLVLTVLVTIVALVMQIIIAVKYTKITNNIKKEVEDLFQIKSDV